MQQDDETVSEVGYLTRPVHFLSLVQGWGEILLSFSVINYIHSLVQKMLCLGVTAIRNCSFCYFQMWHLILKCPENCCEKGRSLKCKRGPGGGAEII